MGEEKTLTLMADAFKELADAINQPDGEDAHLGLRSFSRACSLVFPLFRCLGIAFKFAELDYVAKVRDLEEASKSINFLPVMVDRDIEANCVRIAGSHTRNLLRVKRGIDMVKVLFEHIISSEGNSLKDPALKAYAQVFAPYHGWAIRKAFGAGMYALPNKLQLLNRLNEDETGSTSIFGEIIITIITAWSSSNLVDVGDGTMLRRSLEA
ncbi:Accelerated cell death 11 [Orobanche gracilis]